MGLNAGSNLIALLAVAEPVEKTVSVREGYGSFLFTLCFLLAVVIGIIWWLKRNYG
jgi:hypothetical protein